MLRKYKMRIREVRPSPNWHERTHVQSTSLKKYSTMDVKTQEHYVEDGDDMYLH